MVHVVKVRTPIGKKRNSENWKGDICTNEAGNIELMYSAVSSLPVEGTIPPSSEINPALPEETIMVST